MSELSEMMDSGQESWMNNSACDQESAHLFFATDQANIQKVEQICRERCTVVMECLEFALRANQEFGVWGGMVAQNRRRLRRRIQDRTRKQLDQGLDSE